MGEDMAAKKTAKRRKKKTKATEAVSKASGAGRKATRKRRVTKKAKAKSAEKPGHSEPAERFSRPEPERTASRRSWSGHHDGPAFMGPFGTRDRWSASESEEEPRGARMGYNVVNQHLEDGWDVADQPSYGSDNLFSRFANEAARGRTLGAQAGQRWLEVLDGIGSVLRAAGLPGTLGLAQGAQPEEFWKALGLDRKSSSQSSANFALRISSGRDVEISVDLGGGAVEQPSRAHLSHTQDPQLGRVLVAEIEQAQDGGAMVTVVVADDMPSGVYSGAVMSADVQRPLGTITLKVLD